MSAADSSIEGITSVSLADLIALRARAGKPVARAARIRSTSAGGHATALRGRGMDYAESRAYQAGDDARNIDWRRTARSGKWHTKLFEAERERSVLVLIDTHATMRFGTRTRFKSVAAARAAAWLAWTAVRGGDRVGALAFGAVRGAIDPHAGSRGALAVAGALARWDATASGLEHEAGEPLSEALVRAGRTAANGSRVWLFSDGWCTDAAASATLARVARHVDVRVVVVADALETQLPLAGRYPFATQSETRTVNLAAATARARFRDSLAAGRNGLSRACDAVGVPWCPLVTRAEPELALAGLWRGRRQPG